MQLTDKNLNANRWQNLDGEKQKAVSSSPKLLKFWKQLLIKVSKSFQFINEYEIEIAWSEFHKHKICLIKRVWYENSFQIPCVLPFYSVHL